MHRISLEQVYARAYGLQTVMVRAFNHIGPRQTEQFVLADFCHQVALIEAGKQKPILKVGNQDAECGFCDVRDIVRAYILLAAHGISGETYDVGSGQAVSIKDILGSILAWSQVPNSVEVDPMKYRPTDIPSTRTNIDKLCAAIGWHPEWSLSDSLASILTWWRGEM